MTRLDVRVSELRLARSRTHARERIERGDIRVNGVPIAKPSARVTPSDAIDGVDEPGWVGRGALKLVAALEAFSIDVEGRMALDVGASTGGFTQVLRARGADPVIALDVGHSQLAGSVRSDPGVIPVEGCNARDLTPEVLADRSGTEAPPAIATIDVSFIPLRLVLGPVASVLARDASVVALIKPQFEVGRTGIRDGIVTDPALRARAVEDVAEHAARVGLSAVDAIASPMLGAHGNREYLIHLRQGVPTADPLQTQTEQTQTGRTQASQTEWHDRIRHLEMTEGTAP